MWRCPFGATARPDRYRDVAPRRAGSPGLPKVTMVEDSCPSRRMTVSPILESTTDPSPRSVGMVSRMGAPSLSSISAGTRAPVLPVAIGSRRK